MDRWLTVSVRQGAGGSAEPEFVREGTLASLNARESQDAIYIGFRAAANARKVAMPERLRFHARSEIAVGRGLGSSAAAFVAGAALAAWAGGLSAHLNFSIEPGDFGFTRAVQILVFAVVGGTPSVAGPILGAALLTALPEILRPLKEYRDIFAGLILMAVIIYLPRGLVTLAELRKTRRLQEIGVADVA